MALTPLNLSISCQAKSGASKERLKKASEKLSFSEDAGEDGLCFLTRKDFFGAMCKQ